jgi:DNA polymerase-3 subunit gamma/tau
MVASDFTQNDRQSEEAIASKQAPVSPKEHGIELPGTSPADSNLNQIWQQIIAHLHPLSKALLNEHGQLLAFDGQEAQIGISSDKLVKIAQNQLKNIEKAFVDVFHQKVRVSLEVAGPVSSRASSVPSTFSPAAGESTPVVQPAADSSSGAQKPTGQDAKTQPPGTTPGTPEKTHPLETPSPTQSGEDEPPSATVTPARTTKTEKPPTPSWQEDEAVKAARQLAEFFAGKVVSDDEEISAPGRVSSDALEQDAEPVWSNVSELEETNNEDDVPF